MTVTTLTTKHQLLWLLMTCFAIRPLFLEVVLAVAVLAAAF